jgi:hypothetical protein
MVAAAVSSLIDESDPDVAEDALVDGLHDARTGRVKLRED